LKLPYSVILSGVAACGEGALARESLDDMGVQLGMGALERRAKMP